MDWMAWLISAMGCEWWGRVIAIVGCVIAIGSIVFGIVGNMNARRSRRRSRRERERMNLVLEGLEALNRSRPSQ